MSEAVYEGYRDAADDWGHVIREGVNEDAIRVQARKAEVIYRVVHHVERTRGSIIVPDLAVEQPQRGVVVSVGPDCSGDVAVGDTILFQRYDGYPFRLGGVEHQRIEERDILCVVEGSADNIWIRLPAYTSDKDRIRWT